MPKGPKNTRTKQHKARHKINRLVEQTTKQQSARPTPGPPPQNGQQSKPLGGVGVGEVKAFLKLAKFILGPDASHNTEMHKDSVRIKSPTCVLMCGFCIQMQPKAC